MVEINFKGILIPILAGFWIARKYLNPRETSDYSSDAADEKPTFGSGKMFDKFAEYYDIGNRFMSLGQDQKWRIALLTEASVNSEDVLLDLATGSADVAIAASYLFGARSVVGLDPSVEMLKVGRSKVSEAGISNIELVEGDAQSMPEFKDGKFDKITMSFGIRNVPDRLKALMEMRRVIAPKPNSRLAIMEFSAPPDNTLLGKTAKLFVRHVVPLIGGLITNAIDEYQYLEESIFMFPSPPDFERVIESAGFEMVKTVSYAAGVVNIYIAKPKIKPVFP
jgi:demethylmenaquinone methyltransferase/2-methoxy-6-polyprenyl-1,4-benzoquinol methylase